MTKVRVLAGEGEKRLLLLVSWRSPDRYIEYISWGWCETSEWIVQFPGGLHWMQSLRWRLNLCVDIAGQSSISCMVKLCCKHLFVMILCLFIYLWLTDSTVVLFVNKKKTGEMNVCVWGKLRPTFWDHCMTCSTCFGQ